MWESLFHYSLVLKVWENLSGQVTAKLLQWKHHWAPKKKRKDWILCTLMFCSEPVCSSPFDTVDQFEKHCRKTITILVKLSQSWIKWNILSLQNEIIIISFQWQHASLMSSNSRKIELSFVNFNYEGWVLPCRSTI